MRIDKQDNIWVVDKGSDMILKFNPQGRVEWVFGRKGEASHYRVPPDTASHARRAAQRAGVAVTPPANNNPRNPVPVHRDNAFNQPTDVAWDSQGNSYFTDGYINSRVGKANARGEWLASWGSLGNGPGQFDTPHGIAVSARRTKSSSPIGATGASRCSTRQASSSASSPSTCRSPATARRLRRRADQSDDRLTGARRARRAVHDARPNPVLFVGDLYPSRIYKVSLDGKVLGVYGKSGKNLGEFGWIHAIACPSENEIWVGELLNWRVQKLVMPRAAPRRGRPGGRPLPTSMAERPK